MGPDFSGGGDGGPRELCKALRYNIHRYSVGFFVDWKSGAKDKGVLLYLSLEQLRSFPDVVVYVTLLKGGELERMNPCVDFEGPW